MRIVHVTCLYPPEHRGGAPQQCRQIAMEQSARGHEVAVFSGVLAPGQPALKTTDSVQDGLLVRRVVTNDGFPDYEERNWRHPAVEEPFRDLLASRRPDVVHFHSIQSLGASLIAVATDAGARTVVTMHDLWWICQRQFCIDRRYRPCLPAVTPGSCACETGVTELFQRRAYLTGMLGQVDLVLTPSEAVVERLRMSGVEGRVEVDPNGVPQDAPPPPRHVADRAAPLRVLYVGGESKQKGLHVLAAALRVLADRGVPHEADLYGVDILSFEISRLLGGLTARVHKAFEPEERDEVMASHDVLVLPSVMFESSSRAVREALVRGLTVVATESGGPQEVVEHGVNGLLVPQDDAPSLAAAIERLAGDRDLLARLSAAGVRGEVPTPAMQADALDRLYAAIGRPSGPRPDAGGPRRPQESEPRQVLFVAGIDGSPLHYRVHQKIEQLGLFGFRCVLRRYSDPRIERELDRSEAVIVYRSPATRELLRFIRRAHQRGVPVLFDVDDLIFDPDLAETLPTIAHLPAAERELWIDGVRRYRATLLECGLGIASTEEIARQMQRVGVPARVHRNGVDTPLAVVSERARRARGSRLRGPGDEFVIGYSSGTRTHDADLAHVTDALIDFLGAHTEARLVLGGPLQASPALLRLGERVRRLPFISWERHPDRLATFDLSLAPLIEGLFNEAKSSIKWSEAALVEVPTLASASQPFRESVEDGRTGLLARDPVEFRRRLEEAITDRDRIGRLARAGRLAALAQGSPWVLGRNLVDILGCAPESGDRHARPGSDDAVDRWPSEVGVTNLEPAGLLPGVRAPEEGTETCPGEALGEHRVAFELPDGTGPLRRVDVRVATYTRPAQGPTTLTIRTAAGAAVAEVAVPPGDVGDNGWVAFELDAGRSLSAGAVAELAAEPGERLSPYLVPSGRRLVDGRPRGGAVVARTFHEPPVPPDFPDGQGETAHNDHRDSRLSGVVVFAGVVGRRAAYILRTDGPLSGGSRIIRGVGRRVRFWWVAR